MTAFPSHRTKRAFSLVELLVVIALLGILTGLALPALSSVMAGRGLRKAADDVWGLLSSGRQEAVARQAPVAAVVTTDRVGAQQTGRSEAVILIAADRSSRGDGSVEWSWRPISGWRKLAPGIEASVGGGFQGASDLSFPGLRQALPKLEGETVTGFSFIVFQPDGSVATATAEPGLGLSRWQWKEKNPEDSETSFIIVPETGRVRMTAL